MERRHNFAALKKIWMFKKGNTDSSISRNHDLPSIIDDDCKSWMQNGVYHREKYLPSHIWRFGDKEYLYRGDYKNRENFPTTIYSKGRRWL